MGSRAAKLVEVFVHSAGTILIATSIAKIVASTGGQNILITFDPITHLHFRDEFIAAGTIEMLIGSLCLFAERLVTNALLVAWLATSFLVYRFGLVWVGWHKPCSCLGNFTDALHIPPHTADTAMKIILAYLLIGSYATLFWLWRQRRRAERGRPHN